MLSSLPFCLILLRLPLHGLFLSTVFLILETTDLAAVSFSRNECAQACQLKPTNSLMNNAIFMAFGLQFYLLFLYSLPLNQCIFDTADSNLVVFIKWVSETANRQRNTSL